MDEESPKTLKDWNKIDNETKESPTTLAFLEKSMDLTPPTLPLTQHQPPSRHTKRSLRRNHQDKTRQESIDLEEGVTCKILKLEDDTKLFRKVKEI